MQTETVVQYKKIPNQRTVFPPFIINGIPTRALNENEISETNNMPLAEMRPIWMLRLPPEKGTI